MLFGEGKDEVAKLGNFSLCVPTDDDGYYTGPRRGTFGCRCIVPECMGNEPRVGTEIDWFAFGAFLLMMSCGRYPFACCADENRIEFKSRLQEKKRVSKELKHLIYGLCELDVTKRFGAEEVFSHPWFSKVAGRGKSE